MDPYRASSLQVMEFFQDLLSGSAQKFGTFNSHRSALSLICTEDLGNDENLKRFLQGVRRLRPSKPRYSSTWDPIPVLAFLKKMFPHEGLSLRKLSSKLVTLLALTTTHRVQTLSVIKLNDIRTSPSDIRILITDPIKTSVQTGVYPNFTFKFFNNQPELCVASCVLAYIEATKLIRQEKDYLFVTWSRPHKRASSQTISRWIKCTLKTAGIDTSLYTSHSTRHASTSAAYRKGVPVEEIRRSAGWTGKSKIFENFYNRPVLDKNSMVEAIVLN